MAAELAITYTDGRREAVRLTARALVEAERKYGTNGPRIESGLFAAYHQTRPEGLTFDAWLDTVEAVEDVKDADRPQTAVPENA